jgi:type II secretory pathway component GspD/PulD (secretin)
VEIKENAMKKVLTRRKAPAALLLLSAVVTAGVVLAAQQAEEPRTSRVSQPEKQPTTPQPERIVYRVENSPALDVANAVKELIRSETASAAGVGDPAVAQPGAVTIVPEMVSNSLLISAPPAQLEAVTKMIERLDQPPSTIVVRLLIAEVELPEPKQSDAGEPDKAAPQSALLRTLRQSSLTGVFAEGESGAVLNADEAELDKVLEALEKKGRVKIIARPQLMMLNNQPALLHTGKRVPVWIKNPKGGTASANAQMENIGLRVAVTPRVSRKDMVAINIQVERAEAKPSAELAEYVDLKTVDTTVEAGDGQVVILGGMTTVEEQGGRELLVLMSPSIIEPGSEER